MKTKIIFSQILCGPNLFVLRLIGFNVEKIRLELTTPDQLSAPYYCVDNLSDRIHEKSDINDQWLLPL